MSRPNGAWSRASQLAAATPDSRNRYVDFLRALSICMVVVGHWLVAAPYLVDGHLNLTGNMLESRPWTQWLTWLFQVMPVFFMVGGYSNGVSWRSAVRDGRGYSEWLSGRLQRLVGPILPLLTVWALLALAGRQVGIDADLVKTGSQMALVPVWFLAVYVGVVVVVPLTHAAWRRFGLSSFWFLLAAVVLDDVLFFNDVRALGWFNYAFIWLAVHQLGYAWLDGKLGGSGKTLLWGASALVLLLVLVQFGPYPLSMVSVPGEEISNSLPPKLPMLLLGIAQCGLLLALEQPARRWLSQLRPWTAAVLINGMIMTVFLWHLTAAMLVISVAIVLDGVGLEVDPGSGLWWMLRPVWLSVYVVVLLGLIVVFLRFERAGKARTVAAWRQLIGAALVCAGLSLLALMGIGGEGGMTPSIWIVLLPFVGAAVTGVNPLRRM
ncbi:MAG: acyltransferase family protein [Gemmatimonadota bacterium]|nr:MAG: acyltransferase family protein [Gemmatimonadota bacterium]